MTSNLSTLMIDVLASLAVGTGLPAGTTGRTTNALERRKLAVYDSIQWQITPEGRREIGVPEPMPKAIAKNLGFLSESGAVADKPKRVRSKKAGPCACECGGMTGGGQFLPGHDAKLAGVVGRRIVGHLAGIRGEPMDDAELVIWARQELGDWASMALVAKTARIAATAQRRTA